MECDNKTNLQISFADFQWDLDQVNLEANPTSCRDLLSSSLATYSTEYEHHFPKCMDMKMVVQRLEPPKVLLYVFSKNCATLLLKTLKDIQQMPLTNA